MRISKEIKFLGELIKERFTPLKIILFGSYAYGNPKEESDIDLLVIMETKEHYPKESAKIRLYLDEHSSKVYPMEILVRSPQEIEKRIAQNDFFIKTILEKGIEL